jgi:alpha-L-fucosidase
MYSGFKQDIVKLYVDAFRAAGITPCLYFSIWDRTEGIDKGSVTKEDLDLIVGQLTELLTNYGDIPLLMFDGWTWKMGHREAPYQLIRETVRKLQPNCLIVDHTGTVQPFEEDLMNFEHFDINANNVYAATRGTPIMAKWFWHPGYDTQSPLAASSILSRLGNAEAHNANLLLDCPPNRDGKLDDNIVKRLAEVGASWKPLASRPPLPEQPDQVVHAVTPAAVTASSNASTAGNAIDGINDYVSAAAVQTLWTSSGSLPQSITLDLGRSYTNLDAMGYLPDQDRTVANDITTIRAVGAITAYNVYASDDNKTFTKVASGSWAADGRLKTAKFPPTTARYLRLEATAVSGGGAAVVNEIDAGAIANIPGELTTIAMDGRIQTSGFRFQSHNGVLELQGLDPALPAAFRILSLDGDVMQEGDLTPGGRASIPITAKGWGWKVLEIRPKGGAPVSGTFFLQ